MEKITTPARNIRQANIQLTGTRRKLDAKWLVRGGMALWILLTGVFIRLAYVNVQVVSSNHDDNNNSHHGQGKERQSLPVLQGNPGTRPRRRGRNNQKNKPLEIKTIVDVLDVKNKNDENKIIHEGLPLKKDVEVLTRIKPDRPVATVAHAVSFLSCGYSLTEKYKDAMLVLRHSIHQNSWHNPNSTSRYSYQMYAFVNNDPEAKCSKYTNWIQRMGYTPLLLPNPINLTAIENEWFRGQIDKTGVAGSSELIKLYLYSLTDHPIVCHWDIDVIIKVSTTVSCCSPPRTRPFFRFDLSLTTVFFRLSF